MFVNFSLADFSIFFINFSFLAVCLLFKSFAVLTSSLYLHLLTGSSGVDMKPIALQAGTKHVSTVLSLKDYRGCHGSKFHLKLLGDGVLLRTLWWQGQLKSSQKWYRIQIITTVHSEIQTLGLRHWFGIWDMHTWSFLSFIVMNLLLEFKDKLCLHFSVLAISIR